MPKYARTTQKAIVGYEKVEVKVLFIKQELDEICCKLGHI